MDGADGQRAQLDDIAERLALVQEVFEPARLTRERTGAGVITSYYTQSVLGYRWLHSIDGSIHMALNPDGVFDRSGYYGQVRRLQAMISPGDEGLSVLELGSGMGFNGLHLAKVWPAARITGIDLTPVNVAIARRKGRAYDNVTFDRGDFHRLPYADHSYDLLFGVESVCHATDLRQALDEAFRVARPDARLVVFDGFRRPGFDAMDAQVQLAALLTEAAMAVAPSWIVDDWLHIAISAGFEVVDRQDLTEEIMPNLRRLERMARRFFTSPVRRMIRLATPRRMISNAVAGLLLPSTTAVGAHSYQMIVLQRPR